MYNVHCMITTLYNTLIINDGVYRECTCSWYTCTIMYMTTCTVHVVLTAESIVLDFLIKEVS